MVYSLDLRKKALEYMAKGGTYSKASEIFGVTSRTLANWKRKEKQHELSPKMNGSRPSKIANEDLKNYIENHPDKYLREIAEVFGTTLQAVFYACKRIGITLKKRSHSTKKGMKKNGKNSERN
jgi:transposase